MQKEVFKQWVKDAEVDEDVKDDDSFEVFCVLRLKARKLTNSSEVVDLVDAEDDAEPASKRKKGDLTVSESNI